MPKSDFTKQLTSFLQRQPPEQVAKWLANTIVADKILKKQWQIKLLLASGKPGDYKKMLTQALPKKELIHTSNLWRKVGIYFNDAHALFALAFEHLDQGDCPLTNEQQFTWLMQAFERINFVLETIDDSGGYRLKLVDELSARLVASFHQLDWPLEEKARWLHEHHYHYDVFPYIPEHFHLPADLQAAFTRQAGEDASRSSGQQTSPKSQSKIPDNVSQELLEMLRKERKP